MSTQNKGVIFFELNEVPLFILKDFALRYPKSTISLLLQQGRTFETVAQDKGHLSPWITWPSMHRGVSNEKHFIGNIGDDLAEVDSEYPPIWKILQKHGVSTGVFNSLHSASVPNDYQSYSFYVPDPFAVSSVTHPGYIKPFQALNLYLSRQSAQNVSGEVPFKKMASMATTFPKLGFKASTLVDTAAQLVKERLDAKKLVRRRSYQSILSFDIFFKLLQTQKPSFSTYFTNHLASAMHRFWAARYPDHYEEFTYDNDWVSDYCGELDFALLKADTMLTRVLSFIKKNKNYQLWLASSMGQEATTTNSCETVVALCSSELFMTKLGLSRGDWECQPAMLPQYNFQVNQSKLGEFTERLKRLRIGGKPVEFKCNGNLVVVTLGQPNIGEVSISLGSESGLMTDFGVYNMELDEKSGANAYHIPEGSLIIFSGQEPYLDCNVEKISALSVLPSILANYGIRLPSYVSESIF